MKDTIKKQSEDFVDCKINKAAAATEANGVSWSEFVKRQATILRIKGLCQLAEQFGVVRKRESRGLRPIDLLASADSAESTSSSDDDMGQQEDEDSSTARTRRWTLARARMQGTTRSRKRASLPTTTDAKRRRTQGEQAGQDRLAQLEKLVHGQQRQMHSQQRKLSELKSRVRDNEVQWETWLEGALEKALKKPMDQVLRLLNEKARVEKNDMLEALEQTAKVIVEKVKRYVDSKAENSTNRSVSSDVISPPSDKHISPTAKAKVKAPARSKKVTLPLADEKDAFVPSKTPHKAKANTLMRSKRADLNEEDAFKKNIKIPSKSKLQFTKELLVCSCGLQPVCYVQVEIAET